jgi:sodium/bile acid cotransporter 7
MSSEATADSKVAEQPNDDVAAVVGSVTAVDNGETETQPEEEKREPEAGVAAAETEPENVCSISRIIRRVRAIMKSQRFILGMIFVIAMAGVEPDVGRKNGPLAPQITVKYIAVPLVLLLSGLSLKSEAVVQGLKRVQQHLAIQTYSLLFIPLVMYFWVRVVLDNTSFPSELSDGLLIASCMPTTVSMCVILTAASDGDQVTAVFNATLGNIIGIFATPALLLLLLGAKGSASTEKLLVSLVLTILLPLIVGQLLRLFGFVKNTILPVIKPWFKPINEIILLFIVYTTFCDTFDKGVDVRGSDLAILLIMVPVVYCLFLLGSVALFKWKWLWSGPGQGCGWMPSLSRRQEVASWFCSAHKTVAVGIPMINIIYENDPNKGLYTVPLLIWHPTQLLVGTLLTGKFRRYANSGDGADGIDDDGDDEKDNDDGDAGADDAADGGGKVVVDVVDVAVAVDETVPLVAKKD